MAPELFTVGQHGAGPASDIWAVGITAIELAEGEPPYARAPGISVIRMVRDGPPPRLGMRVEDDLLSDPLPAHSSTKSLAKAVSKKALRKGSLLLKKPEAKSLFLNGSRSKRKAPAGQWSPEFADFVAFCLQKDPRARPTAAELLAHPFVRQITDSKSFKEKGGAAYLHNVLKKWHAQQHEEKKAAERNVKGKGKSKGKEHSHDEEERVKRHSSKKKSRVKKKRSSRGSSVKEAVQEHSSGGELAMADEKEKEQSEKLEEEEELPAFISKVSVFHYDSPGSHHESSAALDGGACDEDDTEVTVLSTALSGRDYRPEVAVPVRHEAPACEDLSEATPLVHSSPPGHDRSCCCVVQ